MLVLAYAVALAAKLTMITRLLGLAFTFAPIVLAIIFAPEEFDVRREVLRKQVVVRETHNRHLFVRVDFTRADAWKMFEATETARRLKAAHIDGRVAENFAGAAPV